MSRNGWRESIVVRSGTQTPTLRSLAADDRSSIAATTGATAARELRSTVLNPSAAASELSLSDDVPEPPPPPPRPTAVS